MDQNNSAKIDKATIIAFLVVVGYTILWTPYLIATVLTEYTDATMVGTASFKLFDRFALFLGLCNCIVNCIVYTLLNNKFRSKLYKVKCCREP